MAELLLMKEVYAIIGAAMEVYNTLGPGFLEAVYQEAFAVELRSRTISFESQRVLEIFYKGRRLEKSYTADMIAYEKIIIEIKALDQLTTREESQLLNYLKATGHEVGVLINFGSHGKLEWKRMALTQKKSVGRS